MIDEPEALLRVVLAAVAGAIIGLEREVSHKPAGVRTYSMVSLGACTFVIVLRVVGILWRDVGDPA
ncbi:MAG: MgtC/SapB family protein [Chloroflexota bacterium]|nr:MgtC/SapB family protein [Chloroflexota bacterium]